MLLRRHKIHQNFSKSKKSEITKEEILMEQNHSSYTKTDIMRMSKEALVELAKKENVPNAEIFNGTELKEMLIEKFQL